MRGEDQIPSTLIKQYVATAYSINTLHKETLRPYSFAGSQVVMSLLRQPAVYDNLGLFRTVEAVSGHSFFL